MRIIDFNRPTKHPFGMLDGYKDACEKEEFLAFMLDRSIAQGSFDPISTQFDHSSVVRDGLVEETEPRTYRLTKKALGLLYGFYGK